MMMDETMPLLYTLEMKHKESKIPKYRKETLSLSYSKIMCKFFLEDHLLKLLAMSIWNSTTLHLLDVYGKPTLHRKVAFKKMRSLKWLKKV